jgi:hypothetical protein
VGTGMTGNDGQRRECQDRVFTELSFSKFTDFM